MSLERTREQVKIRILETAGKDTRVLAILDYGATAEGRGDAWSDLDIALFIRDRDFEDFLASWESWSEQFGVQLVSFIGGVGKPWAVYDADPVPLRVDFDFHPESEMEAISEWPNSPVSVDAMVLYDETDGKISKLVEQMKGKSLAPDDLEAKFKQVASDFWYYLLRTHAKVMRHEAWSARHDFNFIIVGNLAALLRIEAGEISRWKASSAMDSIEADISNRRLTELDRCIVGPGLDSLRQAMLHASGMGRDVCQSIARQHSWSWPSELATRVAEVMKANEAG